MGGLVRGECSGKTGKKGEMGRRKGGREEEEEGALLMHKPVSVQAAAKLLGWLYQPWPQTSRGQ